MIKNMIVITFVLAMLFQVDGAELTGTYKKREQKKGYTPYLKVDSRAPDNMAKRIQLSDNFPDALPDGTEIWIRGQVITRLSGNPDLPLGSAQQPPHWEIIFVVEDWKRISKAFERPENKSEKEPRRSALPLSRRDFSDNEVNEVVHETMQQIQSDLKKVKAQFPQLADIDKAEVTLNRFDYSKGMISDSNSKGARFKKYGCDIGVTIEYPARTAKPTPLESSPFLKLGNGRYLKYWKLIRAERTEQADKFKKKVRDIISQNISGMLDSLGHERNDYVSELPEGAEIPEGKLGYPLGKYLKVQGMRAEKGEVGVNTLIIDTVDGKKLKEPVRLWIENVEALPKDTRCIFRGYESGKMIGVPEELAKAENRPLPQSHWHFKRYFIVTTVVKPKTLQKETNSNE